MSDESSPSPAIAANQKPRLKSCALGCLLMVIVAVGIVAVPTCWRASNNSEIAGIAAAEVRDLQLAFVRKEYPLRLVRSGENNLLALLKAEPSGAARNKEAQKYVDAWLSERSAATDDWLSRAKTSRVVQVKAAMVHLLLDKTEHGRTNEEGQRMGQQLADLHEQRERELAARVPRAEVAPAGYKGLGVSRAAAKTAFERLGFKVDKLGVQTSWPPGWHNTLNMSKARGGNLSLTGPPNDLALVCVAMNTGNPAAALPDTEVREALRAGVLIALPGTQDADALLDSLKASVGKDGKAKTTVGGHPVEYWVQPANEMGAGMLVLLISVDSDLGLPTAEREENRKEWEDLTREGERDMAEGIGKLRAQFH